MAAESAASPASGPAVSWLPAVLSGAMIGFMEVLVAISFASLIFSGPLQGNLARGIGMALVTVMLHLAVGSVFSSIKSTISSIQDAPAVLLAVVISGLVGVTNPLPTAIAIVTVSTLLTGLGLLLLGQFRLGNLVRFLPYPVIGGFLAGTGWLLVQGSFGTMANYNLEAGTLSQLATPEQIRLWLPGVLFGLAIFIGLRKIDHFLVLPGLLVGGIVVYYGWLALTGVSVEAAAEQGLLLGSVSSMAQWVPLPLADLAAADWGVVLSQGSTIITILGLSAVTILLNLSGIELAVHQEMELNRELRVYGAANLAAALLGGMIGFPTPSITGLAFRMGGKTRLTAGVAALMPLVVLVVGASLLAYLPKAIIGGMLLFIGLDFLFTWVVDERKQLDRPDYFVIWAILITIALSGFLAGVAAGLLLTILRFVLNYSQLDILERVSDGRASTSHVQRQPQAAQLLYELGEETYILQLSGFIFFGTATHVVESVRTRLNDPQKPRLHTLILDGRNIDGMDSSSAFSFRKIQQLVVANNIHLLLSGFRPSLMPLLARSGLKEDANTHILPDLDHALEWTEEQQLAAHPLLPSPRGYVLEQLMQGGMTGQDVDKILDHLERKVLPANTVIMEINDRSDVLYFIVRGRVSVYLTPKGGKRVRLFTLNPGATVGEIGFLLDQPRSASVITDVETQVLCLRRATLEQLQHEDPQLLIHIQKFMLRMVASRLILTNNKLLAAAENSEV